MRRSRTLVLLISVLAIVPAFSGCLGSQVPVAADLAAAPGKVHEFDFYTFFARYDPGTGRPFFSFSFVEEGATEPSVPAREIRVKEGDTVRVTLHDAQHTIHWHGVSVPWAMDGVPFMTQTVGEGKYVYQFVAHETGTFWYHCHVEAPFHIDMGMLGAFIVEPRDPSVDPPFDREATLILHETDAAYWSLGLVPFTQDPGYVAPPGNPALLPAHLLHAAEGLADIASFSVTEATGMGVGGAAPARDEYGATTLRYTPEYDTFMINGKVFPHTEPVMIKTGETLRLRLINGGQLPHAFHIHGHRALVTHKDGALLSAPWQADTIGLFPGERYDVYIKGNNPGIWDMHDHGGTMGAGAFAANAGISPGGMNTMLVYEDFPLAELPEPTKKRTSGDYMVFAKGYQGYRPPPPPPSLAKDPTVAAPPAAPGHHEHAAPGAAEPAKSQPKAETPTLVERVTGLLPESAVLGARALWVRLSR